MNKKTAAIILSGGIGERINAHLPKQFLEIAQKPIIAHTLEHFEKNALISEIIVVSDKDHVKDINELVEKYGFKKVHKVVPGGNTRQGSSFIGVKNCADDTEFVLIHDAVRPFVDEKIIKDTLAAAVDQDASGCAIDTADTIIIQEDDLIKEIPDRKNLKRIQTPQGFCYKTILKAHEWALENNITDSTDDCGLVLAMGKPVKIVEGSVRNIKITEPIDFFLAEKVMQDTIGL